MHKYGETKTTRIMMATIRYVTAWAGRTEYQAAWFLLNRVYQIIWHKNLVFGYRVYVFLISFMINHNHSAKQHYIISLYSGDGVCSLWDKKPYHLDEYKSSRFWRFVNAIHDLDPDPIHATLVVEEVKRVLRDFLINITPLMFHNHVIPNITLIRKINGQNLGIFKERKTVLDVRKQWTEEYLEIIKIMSIRFSAFDGHCCVDSILLCADFGTTYGLLICLLALYISLP